jgi:hypothetical protein
MMHGGADDLLSGLTGLFLNKTDSIANAAAAIWQHVPNLNWADL